MTKGEPKIYLRPHGFLSSEDALREIKAGFALPLAGGALAFTFLEIIQRYDDGQVTSRSVRVCDLSGMMLLIGQDRLRRLTEARAPLAGLTFNTPRLMGILNITPDSFSDGGRFPTQAEAISAGEAMRASGAEIIDVGGESTRPGAHPVDLRQECERVCLVVEALADTGLVSIDTRKAGVFEAAHERGARMWNDVSALSHDSGALTAASQTSAHVVLMHAQGSPETMQAAPVYQNALLDVYDYLQNRIAVCEAAGMPRSRIIVDPGIGFGKTAAHNLELMQGLALFHALGCIVMLGASRKSFIGALDANAAVDHRLAGSLAAVLAGAERGVQLFRVHDVDETRQALKVFNSVTAGHENP